VHAKLPVNAFQVMADGVRRKAHFIGQLLDHQAAQASSEDCRFSVREQGIEAG
jgi:hypothetical protein